MNNPLLKKLVTALIAVLLLVYVGYQIYNANYSSVKTETAAYASMSDSIKVEGSAVRKETVVTQEISGVLSYIIEDGGKVAKGGVIAETYANDSDASVQRQLEELDGEISKLQSLGSGGNTVAATADSLDKQIAQELLDVIGSVRGETQGTLAEEREELLYLMNERQIVTGKVTDFNQRISDLKARREALAGGSGQKTGTVTAPAAGYFISQVDGWESVFDYDSLSALTVDQLKQKQASQVTVPAGNIGKIAENFNWYYLFIASPSDAAKFKKISTQTNNYVSIQFPFATTQKVQAKVSSVNQADKDSEAVVVLECSAMNSALATIRNETAQVLIGEYEGVRVSQKAVHFETITKKVKDKDGNETEVTKKVQGVYVRHGSEINFKQIVPLFSTEGYVICDTNPEEDLMTDETVSLYDEVVIEGTDLYDGKVIR